MEPFAPRTDILPLAQQQLWPHLRPITKLGYVLYGGTAVALRLGHRQSVDFDFFTSHAVNRHALRENLPFLSESEVTQDHGNTFEVITASGVKISFFGEIDFGRADEPQATADEVMVVASLTDLMATKLKVILQRSAAKDYQDIAAMVALVSGLTWACPPRRRCSSPPSRRRNLRKRSFISRGAICGGFPTKITMP